MVIINMCVKSTSCHVYFLRIATERAWFWLEAVLRLDMLIEVLDIRKCPSTIIPFAIEMWRLIFRFLKLPDSSQAIDFFMHVGGVLRHRIESTAWCFTAFVHPRNWRISWVARVRLKARTLVPCYLFTLKAFPRFGKFLILHNVDSRIS
jgi:hypothetical protein